MSNVVLTIGGRNFTVAAAAGEEAHVAALGRTIDAKLAAMGGTAGQSETRMLLFAALLLADDLHEAKASPPPPADNATAAVRSKMAETLNTLATRLENIASRLEG